MKIGICGHGVIGEVISKYFNTEMIYDKYKNIGCIENLLLCEIIFIALPTPEKNGKYDMSEIYDISEKLINYNGNVILKSTVEPNTTEYLSEKYNLSISHNPEFLSEKTSQYDYYNQNHIVVGFTNNSNKDFIKEFFVRSFPNCNEFTFCKSKESELMKLVVNGFYATKVQYFTEIYLLCEKLGIEYNKIREMILKNGWINMMHTMIPGHDNNISFGGKCLPKDIQILISLMNEYNVPNNVISNVLNEQKIMR